MFNSDIGYRYNAPQEIGEPPKITSILFYTHYIRVFGGIDHPEMVVLTTKHWDIMGTEWIYRHQYDLWVWAIATK